jgi:hypothetical protein
MSCKETRQRMTPYIDGELLDPQRQVIDEHLEECSSCARRAAFEKNFNLTLREGLGEVEVPAGVIARVRRGIAGEARSTSRGFFGRWVMHPLAGYATAAELLVALVLPAALGGAPGIGGWQTLFQAVHVTSGTLVCVECDRAHMTAEEQQKCRRFNHHTGVKTADGQYWNIVHRGAGAELNERPELRGSDVKFEAEAFLKIHTLDVQSYSLS